MTMAIISLSDGFLTPGLNGMRIGWAGTPPPCRSYSGGSGGGTEGVLPAKLPTLRTPYPLTSRRVMIPTGWAGFVFLPAKLVHRLPP